MGSSTAAWQGAETGSRSRAAIRPEREALAGRRRERAPARTVTTACPDSRRRSTGRRRVPPRRRRPGSVGPWSGGRLVAARAGRVARTAGRTSPGAPCAERSSAGDGEACRASSVGRYAGYSLPLEGIGGQGHAPAPRSDRKASTSRFATPASQSRPARGRSTARSSSVVLGVAHAARPPPRPAPGRRLLPGQRRPGSPPGPTSSSTRPGFGLKQPLTPRRAKRTQPPQVAGPVGRDRWPRSG